jgi:hypothetical protein
MCINHFKPKIKVQKIYLTKLIIHCIIHTGAPMLKGLVNRKKVKVYINANKKERSQIEEKMKK